MLQEVYLLEHKFTESAKALNLYVIYEKRMYVRLREVGGTQNNAFWSVFGAFWSVFGAFWIVLGSFLSILKLFNRKV